ncbi:MAG: APC family permease [bacterium]
MSNGEQKISMTAAAVIAFNAMVGAGVLLMPAILSSLVGPASILTLLLSIVLVISMGLSLGRAAETFPGSGWSYLYPSTWGGHIVGLISSFGYIIGLLLAMGVLVQQAGIWVHKVIPFIPVQPLGIYILLILMILILAGAKTSSWAQYLIAVLVITGLFLSGLFGWLNFDIATLTPFAPNGIMPIFRAGPSLLFSFLGFECVCSLYSIVKDPQKNVPKALIYSVIAVGILYFTFVFGFLYSIPSQYFAGGINVPLVDVLLAAYPKYRILAWLVTTGAIFGIVGTLHSVVWAISELLTSVLQKTKAGFVKTLFKKSFWNEKVSVLVCTAIVLLSAILARGESLVAIVAFFIVPAYTLSIMSLLFAKKKKQNIVITLIALFGGGIMIYFSGLSAFEVIVGLLN